MTQSGACRRTDVGTSNRMEGESPSRRKIKGSYSTVIRIGLVGPKGMAKAELDGHQVNIPELLSCAMG